MNTFRNICTSDVKCWITLAQHMETQSGWMVPWLFPLASKTKIEEYVLNKDLPTLKWYVHSLSFNRSRDHQGLILWMKALLSGHRWLGIHHMLQDAYFINTHGSKFCSAHHLSSGYHPLWKVKHHQLQIKCGKSYSMFRSMIHHRKHHLPFLNIRLLG